MENNNVVTCCSLQMKQRENIEEIGTRGHPICLTVPEVTKDKNETSIGGATLRCHPTSVPSMLNE